MDVFALGYTLDRPTSRRLSLEPIFAAIAVFHVAATFILSDAVGDRAFVAVKLFDRPKTVARASVAGAGSHGVRLSLELT